MIYREIETPVELQRIVLCAWLFLTEPSDPMVSNHSVPPDGTTNLVFTRLPDGSVEALLIGPSLTAATVQVVKGSTVSGLRIRPESAQLATGKPPAPAMVQPLPRDGQLAPVWVDLDALSEGACTWKGTIQTLGQLPGGDPVVRKAVDRLILAGGDESVAHLAAANNMSDRQFRRRFSAATGVSPKQFASVQRMRRALISSLDKGHWAGIALDAGFADQPHLSRDIKNRFGTPPGQVAGYLDGISHELLPNNGVRFIQDAEIGFE